MTAIATPAVPDPAAATASRRPVAPRLELLAWIATGIACVAGIIGVIWRFSGGHQAADYGSYVPWGLWIAAYIALVGASAGAFAFAALIFVQRRVEYYRLAILAMLVALGAFAAGMVNVWLDLGHPFRAWKLVLETSYGSVMGVMAWLYGLYAVMLLVGLWATRHGTVPRWIERWSWVAFLFAVAFAGAEGALFGVVGAQPTWESGVTPIRFLVEAGLFGLSLVAAAGVLFGFLDRAMARRIGLALLGLLALFVVVEWSEFSTGLQASVPAKEEALRSILTGDFWWVFWFLHVGLGIVVPAAILLLNRWRAVAVGAAGGLIAVMSIAAKLNLVIPALVQEDIDGLSSAFTGPGLELDYFPSAMEWLVTIGTVGLAGLVVLAGRRILSAALGEPTHDLASASTQERAR